MEEAVTKRRAHNLSGDFAYRATCPPDKAQIEYWDEKFNGLFLRCFRSEQKSWYLRYRSGGRKRFLKLGRFTGMAGGMTYKQASDKAKKELAGLVANGIDPAVERDARRAAKTFGDLCVEYLARTNKKSLDDDRQIINHDLLPRLEHLKAAEITQTDILNVLDTIVDRGKKVLANRTRTLLGTIFKFGIKRAIINPGENPCIYVDARPGGKEKHRERFLNDDEIKAVWGACEAERLGNAARLALLTGQREMEVCRMEWGELDLSKAVWTIPASRSKNKKPHVVPLVGKALAILREIEAGEHDPLRVFSGASKTSAATLMRRLRKATGIEFRFHDLRRTVATGIVALDWRLDPIVSKILNHSSHGVTATVYIHHPFDEEKRAALTKWDRHLDEIINGKPASNVIELRSGAA